MSRRANKIIWEGEEYSSQVKLAEHLGVTPSTVSRYLKKGYTCDDDLNETERNHGRIVNSPFIWEGIIYPDHKIAAESLKEKLPTILARTKYGLHSTEDIQKGFQRRGNNKGIPCVWENKEYPTVKAASEDTGIPYKVLLYRVNRGYTSYDDLKRPGIPYGKEGWKKTQ